jgi:transcriptional antiterminator NusG
MEKGRKSKFYAAMVKTGGEDAFIKSFRKKHPGCHGLAVYFPRRELREKKLGKTRTVLRPVFSGYVFFETDKDDGIAGYKAALESVNGFYRFLHSNTRIAEITGGDLEIITRFIKPGNAVAGVSKVRYDENNRIVVVDGVMKGLEGNIVKVDRRKGRAKIRLDLYSDSFLIDLSFEAVEARV